MNELHFSDDGWWRVQGDTAFDSILEGFPAYNKVIREAFGNVSGGNAVQAGGYCGIFPVLLADFFDNVYTFEPDRVNFLCLVMNSSKATNPVYSYNSLLGNRRANRGIRNLVSSNRGMNVAWGDGPIPTLMIDDLALRDVRYIQLDTEGSEFDILDGATDTISAWKPLISVEDTNHNIVEFLSNFGYKELATVYRDTFYVAS
jgi:FkbM family methyltransferase